MKPTKRKIKFPERGSINPALNQYAEVVLFPEQLKKANEILKKVGIPKI